MSTPAQVLPGTANVAAAPAKPLTAIQIIEQDLQNFFRQKEQAIANVHAIDGAIQATSQLLGKLKAEVIKAEEFAKAEAAKLESAVESGVAAVEAEVKKL